MAGTAEQLPFAHGMRQVFGLSCPWHALSLLAGIVRPADVEVLNHLKGCLSALEDSTLLGAAGYQIRLLSTSQLSRAFDDTKRWQMRAWSAQLGVHYNASSSKAAISASALSAFSNEYSIAMYPLDVS